MSKSIKEKIISRFRANFLKGVHGFVHSQKIQDIMHAETGHKHDYIGRQLRKLAEEKKFEVDYDKEFKGTSMYRYVPSEKEIISLAVKSNV